MWIAIAQCYEKLHRVDDAIHGYERAAAHDDAEGHAMLKLARLHRGRGDHDKAFACYRACCGGAESFACSVLGCPRRASRNPR